MRPYPDVVRLALVMMILWLTYITFQILPLPTQLLHIISPHAADAYADLGIKNYGYISLDRGLTFVNLMHCFCYVSLFYLVITVGNSKDRIHKIIFVLLLTAVAEVAYGLAAEGTDLVFGIWRRAHETVSGSYPNRNHFAGFLEIVISLAIGLYLRNVLRSNSLIGVRSFRRLFVDCFSNKHLWLLACIVFMLFGLMRSASRGGVLSFCIALVTFSLFAMSNKVLRKRILKLLMLPVVICFIAVVATSGTFLTRLFQGGVSGRDFVWQPAIELAKDYAFLGTGVGTFQLAFPAYSPAPSQTWWHAHIDYLELFIEFGMVGFVIMMSGVIMVLVYIISSFFQRKSYDVVPVLFGVLLGVTSIGIHELSEYHFYIPANAAYFFTLLGIGVVISGFETKSKKGTSTPKQDVELIKKRVRKHRVRNHTHP